MILTKSKLSLTRVSVIMIALLVFLLYVMHVNGMLIFSLNVEAIEGLPPIYFSFAILVLALSYMFVSYVIRYFQLPHKIIVDFEKRQVIDGEESSY
ncbi:MAG: hypothetical protein HLUCCO02_09050 [Idiomarinaceae bacterium HL-53]|nr:MAG: hypothetical protein HLUCCO02_09050 [Idiomarinaceae bacterium HL-53]CUS47677.1 hypothetical protein Ga0003345_0610 [Idiomarinaceae bacterium HL-53]